ncbi:hypothetical protein O6H91_Y092000 [Diphasiastrum complanatum]|nr:hypothetical protein O6H91_Y092000 [Diphasiastrum complanatum]KAJ7300027.1 hypothetical protein O6H91_Y092000 [Diphasiastrum complanatum]
MLSYRALLLSLSSLAPFHLSSLISHLASLALCSLSNLSLSSLTLPHLVLCLKLQLVPGVLA